MNWYHREEERYVEYGSSFQATRAFGIGRSLTDTVYNMNMAHLSRAHADACSSGSTTPTCAPPGTTYLIYRGRHRHEVTGETALARLVTSTLFRHAVWGPRELFYADLFASRRDRLPLPARDAGRPRPARGLRRRVPGRARPVRLPAALAARQRHVLAPQRARRAGRLASPQADRAARARIDARRRRARRVPRRARGDRDGRPLADRRRGAHRPARRRSATCDVLARSDPRAGRRPRSRSAPRSARRWSTCSTRSAASASCAPRRRARAAIPGVDLGRAPRRRRGGRARQRARRAALRAGRRARGPARAGAGASRASSTRSARRVEDGVLRSDDYPDALARALVGAALPDAGDVLLSAAPGYEFVDWGGADHVGGGSHGSLHRDDSLGALLWCGAGPDVAATRGAVDAARRRADGARALRGRDRRPRLRLRSAARRVMPPRQRPAASTAPPSATCRCGAACATACGGPTTGCSSCASPPSARAATSSTSPSSRCACTRFGLHYRVAAHASPSSSR